MKKSVKVILVILIVLVFVSIFAFINYQMIKKSKDRNASSSEGKIADSRNILQNTKLSINNDSEDRFESIFDEIKKSYANFNEENYEVRESVTGTSMDINTGIIVAGDTHIDLIFKIGDFYTDAGYVVVVKDGTVEAIYNNNVDIAKQEEALKQKESFQVNLSNSEIDVFREKANEGVNNKYTRGEMSIEEISSNEDIKYYYDIMTGKKYIYIEVLSEAGSGELVGIAYKTVKYELE